MAHTTDTVICMALVVPKGSRLGPRSDPKRAAAHLALYQPLSVAGSQSIARLSLECLLYAKYRRLGYRQSLSAEAVLQSRGIHTGSLAPEFTGSMGSKYTFRKPSSTCIPSRTPWSVVEPPHKPRVIHSTLQ